MPAEERADILEAFKRVRQERLAREREAAEARMRSYLPLAEPGENGEVPS